MGDSDDRQFPERVHLQRPDHLLFRFYDEYLDRSSRHGDVGPRPTNVSELPERIRSWPLLIQDAVLSKLHSAILTDDPVSNLYTCGIGRGGRLGLGDENTRFSFEPVQGPLKDKKIVKVALGQNHSMAITDKGQLWTWGSNTFSQLGYALPPSPKKDEDPMTSVPRQVFGPLRKEYILGIAASAHHSVAHTGSSLYCWGKNVGQLALMDADSRSLDVQAVPRKVAASLFSAVIVSVSAIDRATTVLLANHTVCVFTSYGYRVVKFDFTETIGHQGRLGSFNMSSRYDAGRSQINYIASGGETIAAVTSRGDLFTMNLTNLPDASQSSSSTTNPSKIRDSLTTPQCIWSARKDGVRSVDVGEQGSVIISTHSGAVWRRVKRVKAKDAQASSGRSRTDMKKKDYKFQRVPFISNVVTVRSSAFGAFAAIRCDSDVIVYRGGEDSQTLWLDVAFLMPLHDFRGSEAERQGQDIMLQWEFQMVKEKLSWEGLQILKSTDLINDLAQHLTEWESSYRNKDGAPPGVIFCTTLHPDVRIPMHSWVVSARSPVLRDALSRCRKGDGTFELPDVFSAKTEARADGYSVVVIVFPDMDMLSLLNFVLYMYSDRLVPVWNHARQGAPLANRFRSVRTEVMKFATRLDMPQLETAARVQTFAKETMDQDYRQAIKDPRFFEDADTILELDGAEVLIHRELACERSDWFGILFYGRSKGQWLATRRQGLGPSDKLRIDLRHMNPKAFQCILEHLYTDSGHEYIHDLVVPDMETYLDCVIDVLSIANELMLDRLSQICQMYIGLETTTRNVSQVLNAVSPCSIHELKESGLMYICEQMETMLENHLLDDLDEDLLKDLDKAVIHNQLMKTPYVKSGLAQYTLFQTYPELAHDIEEERQRRVREMAFKAAQPPAAAAPSPSASRARRKSRISKAEPSSPVLRPKTSQADLMFSMEEDELAVGLTDRPRSRGTAQDNSTAFEDRDDKGLSISNSPATTVTPVRRPAAAATSRGVVRLGQASTAAASPDQHASTTPKGADRNDNPWGAQTPNAISRLDLRSIMTETSTSPPFLTKTSALSAGLDAQRAAAAAAAAEPVVMTPPPKIASAPKMSQKERKKQQQMHQQLQDQAKNTPKGPAWDTSAPGEGKRPSLSWQSPSPGGPGPSTSVVPGASSSQPHLAVSQPPLPGPSSGAAAPALQKKQQHMPGAASPDTRFAGQSRPSPVGNSAASAASASMSTRSVPLMPHSKVYIKPAPKAEPVLGLTMADIFLQQQLEQESMKEAVAKRSLQEIQEEQAFQEWWDLESRRAQEEEAQRQSKSTGRGGGGSGGGGSGRKSKKGKAAATGGGSAPAANGGVGASSSGANVHGNSETKSAPKKNKNPGGGGRHRSGGGGGGSTSRTDGSQEATAGDGQPSRRRGGSGGGSSRGGKA